MKHKQILPIPYDMFTSFLWNKILFQMQLYLKQNM